MKLWSEYDRFDLEQDILKCSDVEEYLEEFLRVYLDKPEPMSEDDVANCILGIIQVAKLRHGRLWDGFEQMVEQGQFVLLDKYKPKKGNKSE